VQPMSMTCNSAVAVNKAVTATPQVQCCLPASTHSAATNLHACRHVLLSGSIRPRPRGRLLVPGPGIERAPPFATHQSSRRAPPFVAGRSLRRDGSGHSDLNVGAQGPVCQHFLGTCRPIDDEIMECWAAALLERGFSFHDAVG